MSRSSRTPPRRRARARLTGLTLAGLVAAGCGPGVDDGAGPDDALSGSVPSGAAGSGAPEPGSETGSGPGNVTLAFAGDVHFEGGLARLLDDPDSTLGPLSQPLADADVAVVNLESALGDAGAPTSKELEDPAVRYWFRSAPEALGLLDRSGVDVASMANNHGADYDVAGVRETLRLARDSPVALVGVGADAEAAYAPHVTRVGDTDVAVIAADDSPRESADPVWAAGEGTPGDGRGGGLGLASARGAGGDWLVASVRAAAEQADVVAVYLHWGREGDAAVTPAQRRLAQRLADAGADVVVGAHAHVLQAPGMLGSTYVAYGLGNFAWYNGIRSETGVLQLEVTPDGEVVGDRWTPGRIPSGGGVPREVTGQQATAAEAQWRRLRRGSGLEVPAWVGPVDLPPYASQVSELDPALRQQMRGVSFRAGCPLRLDRLRLVTMSYVGFDGEQHTGQMVVADDLADQVAGIFGRLYDARFPIRRMDLIDEYGGDDDASMAANNSSAFNCRRVAGSDSWSDHAFGRAIDINPVQNPYLTAGGVLPPAGRAFADLTRSTGAQPPAGAVRRGDVVLRAFTEAGWQWGGDYSDPDYQHFYAPDRAAP